MVNEAGAPSVSGISPAEGPPGTVVKIRGENLGVDGKDILGVFICNVNCTYTAEWQHSRLIHARTGLGLGMGDIIVFTKSGGMGTNLVKFRGYMSRVGLLTEAAVWVDESKLFEEKPTTTLSNSRAFSPNSTYTDPLGVAPEETGAVLPADKIEEWYPKSSSNPLSENFNPSRFLLERHLDTSFDALKSGYYHLQSQDTRTSVGPSSFVRGNLTTILDSLFTLNDVQKSMLAHESESIGGNICEELQGVLKSCNFVSNSLFKDILSRKDEADVKRNVLNVLHRYRFLFNLPRSIERNIQQGEYEILISDYNRAKALFQNTEVKSFKKALAEVDQKIAAFSTQLKHKLFDFPTPLEEQKKLIRYLNELDYQGNAGWECITKQTLWIKSLLLDCQLEHQEKEETNKLMTPANSPLENKKRPNDTSLTVTSHQRTPSDSSNFSFSRLNSRSTSLPESLRRLQLEPSNTPQGILMVEELCKLISANLSDLWNLGQTYISNQLGDKEKASDKNGDRKRFQALVKDVIVVFCDMVESVLQRDDRSSLALGRNRFKNLVPWLPCTVWSIWTTLHKLSKLGLASDIIAPLKSLTTSSISGCIKKVLSTAVEDTQGLCKQEQWELEYDRRHSYWTSKLPSMFEKIFNEAITFVHDFMTDSKIDTKNESRELHNDVVGLLKAMLEAFLSSVERTVFPESDNLQDQSDSIEKMQITLSKDIRVVVLLSNCHHIRNVVMPNVIDLCVKFGYEEIKDLSQDIDKAIVELDERAFTTYIELKGEPLVGGIELGVNMAEFNWDGSQPVTGVRPYLQDILIKLIVVHDQISSVSPLFTKRVFVTLVELVVDELHRIFECVDKYSAHGSLQAHLELNAFKEAVGLYISEKASSNIDSVITKLPGLDEKHEKKKQTLLSQFKNAMRYQLAAFGKPGEHVPPDVKEFGKIRSNSADSLEKSTSVQQRDRSKSRSKAPKKKQSWAAQVEVEKLQPVRKETAFSKLTEAPVSSVVTEGSSADAKKTKRKAPTPPKILGVPKPVKSTQSDSTNPFFEESESSNPFLEESDSELLDPSNPFFGDDEV